jgi:hypothetical protein
MVFQEITAKTFSTKKFAILQRDEVWSNGRSVNRRVSAVGSEKTFQAVISRNYSIDRSAQALLNNLCRSTRRTERR